MKNMIIFSDGQPAAPNTSIGYSDTNATTQSSLLITILTNTGLDLAILNSTLNLQTQAIC
jgi:hypothetical protein